MRQKTPSNYRRCLMPELPDVEIFRKRAQQALHTTIDQVRLPKDGVVASSRTTLNKYLRGEQLKEIQRHGKHLFLGQAVMASWPSILV